MFAGVAMVTPIPSTVRAKPSRLASLERACAAVSAWSIVQADGMTRLQPAQGPGGVCGQDPDRWPRGGYCMPLPRSVQGGFE